MCVATEKQIAAPAQTPPVMRRRRIRFEKSVHVMHQPPVSANLCKARKKLMDVLVAETIALWTQHPAFLMTTTMIHAPLIHACTLILAKGGVSCGDALTTDACDLDFKCDGSGKCVQKYEAGGNKKLVPWSRHSPNTSAKLLSTPQMPPTRQYARYVPVSRMKLQSKHSRLTQLIYKQRLCILMVHHVKTQKRAKLAMAGGKHVPEGPPLYKNSLEMTRSVESPKDAAISLGL